MADLNAPHCEQQARAKVNLTLHVTGQRADGLHLLDSLVAFATTVGDALTVQIAEKSSLVVSGPMAAGVPEDDTNLVLRAARLMGAEVEVELFKMLPNAAGLGGGSSDAAAVIRAIQVFTDNKTCPEGIEHLGADVRVCLRQSLQRMRGTGEILQRLASVRLFALLVNPGVAVPTREVFARLAEKENPPMPDVVPEFATGLDAVAWIARQRNDLEPPAIAIAPIIGQVLDRLETLPGCLMRRMSGSGATCFALFETLEHAKQAQDILVREQPDWWVAATTLR